MASQEETILLHFDIDEQPAVNSIKDLRAANSQLRAERDKVNISTKEGKELVDKLNVAIDKNNKVIKDNSSALEKQRQNVGNYSKSIQEAAGNLNIMGTNVGGLATKLTSFLNPATAAVGVVAALGAAYARSTIGAKDLEFATNQLGAATTILTNNFAALISSSEDGEGLFSKLADNLLFVVDVFTLGANDLANQSKKIAQAQEDIDDLSRDEIIARSRVSDILADNQELLTQLNDSQLSYNKKVELSKKALENISRTEDILLDVKKKQLLQAQIILNGDKLNEDKKRTVLEIEREISNIQKDAARKTSGLERLQSNLKDTEQKRLDIIQKQNIELQKQQDIQNNIRNKRIGRALTATDQANFGTVNPDGTLAEVGAVGLPQASIDNFNKQQQDQRDQLQKTANLEQQLYFERLGAASMYFSAAATLAATAFGEGSELFRALALGETIINTYSAATAALAPPPLGAGPVLGPALAAFTIATGLANAARISGVGFAEGGWTGAGSKHKPAGIVHADEYVTPKHIVNSPAAQPHLAALESMRLKGYADGGFVANSNQSEVRQAQMLANALKNQPPIIASWTEGRAVGRKVEFKERVTRQ